MKTKLRSLLFFSTMLFTASGLLAAETKSPTVAGDTVTNFLSPTFSAAQANAPGTWHAQSLGEAIGYMLLFAAIGIAAAIVGYKVFDRCTPGNLHREIVEHKNVAAAIIAAAVILGVCIIIAAAMLG